LIEKESRLRGFALWDRFLAINRTCHSQWVDGLFSAKKPPLSKPVKGKMIVSPKKMIFHLCHGMIHGMYLSVNYFLGEK
jgi:hypothetical protein